MKSFDSQKRADCKAEPYKRGFGKLPEVLGQSPKKTFGGFRGRAPDKGF